MIAFVSDQQCLDFMDNKGGVYSTLYITLWFSFKAFILTAAHVKPGNVYNDTSFFFEED